MKLDKYLEMKEAQGIEAYTLRNHRAVLTHLNTWKDLERITKDDLVEYFNKKAFKEKADSTQGIK